MAVFQYRAKLGPDQIHEGTIDAADQRAASIELTRQGYFLISIAPRSPITASRSILDVGRSVRPQEIILLTNQLADLIESGLPIYQALNVITGQMSNRYFRKIVLEISAKVRDGSSLSSALSSHPQLFSNLYIGMVQSGEESGSLGTVLKRLRRHLEQAHELRRNVKSALVYPSFVLAVGIISIVMLLTIVVPRLVGLFEDVGQSLPLATRMILALSAFFSSYWWVILLAVMVIAAVYSRRKSIGAINTAVEFFKLKIPVLKGFHIKQELGEYTRTLATLLGQKVPMIQAQRIALNSIGSGLIRKRMKPISDQVATGNKYQAALGRTGLLSPFMINVISVGEEAGRLEQALNKVADMYQEDIQTATRRLTSLLEPAIIFLLTIGIGFIIFAVIFPIFQLELFEF